MAKAPMGVWGGLLKAVDDGDDAPEDSDNLCDICMNKTRSVWMQPCRHAACDSCVGKMRAANVFKVSAPSPRSPAASPPQQ
jgi:hypothetical protein